MITLTLSDTNSTMLNEALYAGVKPNSYCVDVLCYNAERVIRFHSRLFAVGRGYVVLERPLPYKIRPEWSPELHLYRPGIEQSGVENLSIEFK
jgi:hypothetical protein